MKGIQMLIGLVIRLTDDLHLGILHVLEETLQLGVVRNKKSLQDQVLKQSFEVWHMEFVRCYGFVMY